MREITIDLKQLRSSNLTIEQFVILQLIYEDKVSEISELKTIQPIEGILSFLSRSLYIYRDENEIQLRSLGEALFNTEDSRIKEILDYMNKVSGKKFLYKSAANKRVIKGRLAQGYSISDLKRVIDTMWSKWKDDPKMSIYFRPETLFNDTKFQGYINQLPNNVEETVGGML